MPGCSLLRNCVTKRVIGCHFTIENQLNFSVSRLGSHFAVEIPGLLSYLTRNVAVGR
jgi:hypothetical protein